MSKGNSVEERKPSTLLSAESVISEHYRERLAYSTDAIKQLRTRRNALLARTDNYASATDVLGQVDRIDESIREQEASAEEALEKLAEHTAHTATLLREQSKLSFEFQKHLSTLGTGSILLGAAVVRGLFPDMADSGHSIVVLFASFACLLYSIVLSVFAMLGFQTGAVSGETSELTERISRASLTLFSGGIGFFVWFTLTNLDVFPFASVVILAPLFVYLLWVQGLGTKLRALWEKNDTES